MMKINSIYTKFIENTTIRDLLILRNEEKTAWIVLVNNKVINKNDYDKYVIKEDDVIKIITSLSGG